MNLTRRTLLLGGISAAIIRPGILMPIKPGRWELTALLSYDTETGYCFRHSLTGKRNDLRLQHFPTRSHMRLFNGFELIDCPSTRLEGERVYIPETFRVLQACEARGGVQYTGAAVAPDGRTLGELQGSIPYIDGGEAGRFAITRKAGRGASLATSGSCDLAAAVIDHAFSADDLLAGHSPRLLRGLWSQLADGATGDPDSARDRPSGRGAGVAAPDPQGALARDLGAQPRDGVASRRQFLRLQPHDRKKVV